MTSSGPLDLVLQHLLILYHGKWVGCKLVFPKEGSLSDVVGKSTRRSFHLLVGATLATGLPIVGALVTASLDRAPRWLPLLWGALLIVLNALNLRWQLRSQEERPEAIKERVSQLQSELRKQVQARSYGTRRDLIEAPLRELDLDITPRLGWVRDPRLVEPEPLSERIADDIVAAFESSKRRLLLVGEPVRARPWLPTPSSSTWMRPKALRDEYRFWSTSQRGKLRRPSKPSSSTTSVLRSATRSVSVPSLARSSAHTGTP